MLQINITVLFCFICAFLPWGASQFLGFHNDFFAIMDSTLLSLSLWWGYLGYCYFVNKKTVEIIFILTVIILIFLKVSQEYFIFFESYISLETLGLFNEVLLGIKNFVSIPILALLFLVTFLFFTFLSKTKIELVKPNRIFFYTLISAISFIAFFVQNTHSQKFIFEKLDEQNEFSSYEYQEENPIMFLVRELVNKVIVDEMSNAKQKEVDFLTSIIQKNQNKFLPPEYHFDKFKTLIIPYPEFSHSGLNVEPFKFKSEDLGSASDHKKTRKNVILIVLESVRKYETEKYNGISLTPNLNEIAKYGVSFENFYSTSRYTIKSEQAILCSLLDVHKHVPYSVHFGKFNGQCLPKILKKNGYHTYWFHGNTKEFFNRDVFHPSIGFQNLISKEYFETKNLAKNEIIGWGIKDEDVFNEAFKILENKTEPFFAEILTLTNHQPFNWDYGKHVFPDFVSYTGENIYKNYRKGINYTDYALGVFWNKFINSPLSDNTILIITGDHGVPYYPEIIQSDVDQFETLFRTPLVVYGVDDYVDPGMQLSHLDIAPSILSELDIKQDFSFLGRPFFGKQKTVDNRPIFNMDIDNYAFRLGNTRCLPVENLCVNKAIETCYSEYRFSCNIENINDIASIVESESLMKFLKLSNRAGYPSF
ncbi:LTA synthase family protein [Thalassotalea nanhaiensis]|uniref:LTA synthase family protein n=1 Tax=Thalassotalea nanhaiensis TaxID=3065648 RepID=A0ABY9TH09_9GAMM|nr:LTA synthase family protein [Colwelliaceae bacterium SQ345]